MALTLQECIDKIKKEYPQTFPYVYIELEGKYVFNLVPKGQDPKEAISDMHVVDPETGYVSGGISIMEFLKDAGFREKWKKPNLVANHDESIGHSAFSYGWRVRRKQHGNKNDCPFESKTVTYEESGLTYGGSLMHYGIKGQKWGVRRFQYENGSYTPEGKERYSRSFGEKKDGSVEDLAIEAAPAAILLSFLAIKAIRNRIYNSPKNIDKRNAEKQESYSNRNKELSRDLIGDIADLGIDYSADNMPRKISGPHSIEDDMSACNPRYNDGVVQGTSNNCTLCAFTYDLRRRGYDVTALCSDSGNYVSQISKSLYKDVKVEHLTDTKSFSDMFEQAAKRYPEGARGEISVYGRYMGHSMAWEIKGGKLQVLDTQRNVKVTPSDLAKSGFAYNVASFVRVDHLEIKPEGISKVCAQLKPGWKKTIAAEKRAASGKKEKTSNKKLTDSQRRKKYEEQYLKEHPNADKNAAGLKNWVDARMGK